MIFTIECTKDFDEIEIYCDQEGIDFFIRRLQVLQKKGSHEHFMTPSWAGDELTEDKQGGPNNILINHLCVAVKPDDFEE